MHALILVDIQNDFLPGGALAVPRGDEVVPVANRLMGQFELVVATQDWHPADHRSFASQHPGRAVGDEIELNGLPQTLWPDHCVQRSPGAELAPELDARRVTHVVRKGLDREIDSYSGFFDNGRRKATGLDDYLKRRGAADLTIIGLATDYCVKFTVLDALRLGYRVTVDLAGVCGVELRAGDCERALAELRAAGASIAPADAPRSER